MKTIKLNTDESVTGVIFWPAEEVENLFKTAQKSRDYASFFKEMKVLWDRADSTHYWPRELEAVVGEARLYLKIPG
jgi:hypothetical protein